MKIEKVVKLTRKPVIEEMLNTGWRPEGSCKTGSVENFLRFLRSEEPLNEGRTIAVWNGRRLASVWSKRE